MPRRKMTQEEKDTRDWKANVKHLRDNMLIEREDYIKKSRQGKFENPPADRIYEVGDRVDLGNIDWVHILEVLEDGRVYKIARINSEFPYGRYAGEDFKIAYTRWTELVPYRIKEEILACDQVLENQDLRFSYSQRQTVSLLWTSYSAGIDLDMDYQRGNVWTEKQQVILIDSIYKNIDIGKFTLIRRPFKEKQIHYYEMLDGKQRFTALKKFYESTLKYKGKYFHEMHNRDKAHFEGYSISYAETEPLTDEQKYRYFLKLNTSGTPQDPNHIKKVVDMWQKEKEKKNDR